MKPHDIRRENLLKLIEIKFEGKAGRLADAIGKKRPLIYRLFSKNEESRREIGEGFAREIENKLSIAVGWLDQEHHNTNDLTIEGAQRPREEGNFLARLESLQKEYEAKPATEKELIDEHLRQKAGLKKLLQ